MSNPYLITGPALISFSGGRTSAYMLKQILDAYGGVLPDDVVVTFANTGKEREETLRFVHDCATYWNVKVRWLEYRVGDQRFEEVGFNSASRAGEPFAALIAKKNYLPNSVTRYCTQELKIRVMRDFAKGALGWRNWVNVIGLRYDEGHRVLKALNANDSGKQPWRNAMPMSKAKVTKRDVELFWASQPFDLQLKPYEGNCDLCFLKSKAKLAALIRENPKMADWWIAQEQSVTTDNPSGHRFGDFSFAFMADSVDRQGFFFDDGEEYDAECGISCASEAA
jgi:3'-phosphoadenosine 5'-phosphosulfate sulfotransferase (PAPS reductase)/FAD synthetase